MRIGTGFCIDGFLISDGLVRYQYNAMRFSIQLSVWEEKMRSDFTAV